MLSPPRNVAIFWDYENCRPPSQVSGHELAARIRGLAEEYGIVKLFRAYTEISDSMISYQHRTELQTSGVSLVDCPHNGRKNVCDLMIIVDMLVHAFDHANESCTIVLISGDRDYAFVTSVLRQRQVQVVLVSPENAHNSLKSQAVVWLDWNADILNQVHPKKAVTSRPTGLPSPPLTPTNIAAFQSVALQADLTQAPASPTPQSSPPSRLPPTPKSPQMPQGNNDSTSSTSTVVNILKRYRQQGVHNVPKQLLEEELKSKYAWKKKAIAKCLKHAMQAKVVGEGSCLFLPRGPPAVSEGQHSSQPALTSNDTPESQPSPTLSMIHPLVEHRHTTVNTQIGPPTLALSQSTTATDEQRPPHPTWTSGLINGLSETQTEPSTTLFIIRPSAAELEVSNDTCDDRSSKPEPMLEFSVTPSINPPVESPPGTMPPALSNADELEDNSDCMSFYSCQTDDDVLGALAAPASGGSVTGPTGEGLGEAALHLESEVVESDGCLENASFYSLDDSRPQSSREMNVLSNDGKSSPETDDGGELGIFLPLAQILERYRQSGRPVQKRKPLINALSTDTALCSLLPATKPWAPYFKQALRAGVIHKPTAKFQYCLHPNWRGRVPDGHRPQHYLVNAHTVQPSPPPESRSSASTVMQPSRTSQEVSIGPLIWDPNYNTTQVFKALVELMPCGSALRNCAVDARADGEDHLLVKFQTVNDVMSFVIAWSARPPAGFEEVNVSWGAWRAD